MKRFLKGITFFMSVIMVLMLYIGCAPGKVQTRTNDYKDNFATENYETFDLEDPANDDNIPRDTRSTSNDRKHYGDTNRVKSSYSQNEASSSQNMLNQNKSFTQDGQRNVQQNDQYGQDQFYQQGMASWYGREFDGKVTASGERFDMNIMTAAHKTLPFNTVIDVKNLDNGKTVRVRVNDRGPYKGNRIVDMSYAAAKELDMVQNGEARVGINVVTMGDNKSASSSSHVTPVSDQNFAEDYDSQRKNYNSYDDNYKVQVGAFYSRNNADKLKYKIESMTDRPVFIVQEGDFYKVRVKGLRDREEADKLKDKLYYHNISSFVIE